jgi:hypothetical protein
MSGTQTLLLIGIFALAALLIALPRIFGRRAQAKGPAADGPAPDPDQP